MATRNTDQIHKTTDRAITLLDYVRKSNGATLAEILDEFDMARSTAHMHLNTLVEHGFLVRENGQYCIGLRFREFSVSARNRRPSYQIVKKELEKVENDTGSEVEFLVQEAGMVTLIHHSESVRHDRVRLHMHNTAAGKAILSELPPERVEEIIERRGLPAKTSTTITEKQRLFEELDKIQEQGYAYNNRECFEGYHGIGSAIEGIDGSILGAIAIGGPVYRVDEDVLKTETADVLTETVSNIEDTINSQREAISAELAKR